MNIKGIMVIFNKLKLYLMPTVPTDVQENIDREGMRNISHVSLFALLFESFIFLVFLVTRSGIDQKTMFSVTSVGFAIVTCTIAYLGSREMLSKQQMSHGSVLAFKVSFFVAFTTWAVIADYRQYMDGNQMLTFFTVEMLMVCFMLFRPIVGLTLMSLAFLGLYLMLCSFDGAARIVIPNYLMLWLVSVFGMMVRFHTQMHLSAKTTRLIYTNKVLENVGRHDGLTGLRNRKALNEDVLHMPGTHICAYMVDVNYFKDINDTYGHMVGDAVLQTVSSSLRKLYPNSQCYRFGGDEFLVLSEQPKEELYTKDTYQFRWRSEEASFDVGLSIGYAEGTPMNHEELLDLIARADGALYEVKKRTHSLANGGHERRGQQRAKKSLAI